MPRPNRAITALKKRDYHTTIWELLLHEYRCAKNGDTEHRLGPNALSSLIAALRDLEEKKNEGAKDSDRPNLIELEEWVKESKG
jgi:hypothetical protein